LNINKKGSSFGIANTDVDEKANKINKELNEKK
jgi:hypothetical protein